MVFKFLIFLGVVFEPFLTARQGGDHVSLLVLGSRAQGSRQERLRPRWHRGRQQRQHRQTGLQWGVLDKENLEKDGEAGEMTTRKATELTSYASKVLGMTSLPFP